MDDNIRQHLRAEYMRGDIDHLHVINTLEQHMTTQQAQEMALRWLTAKRREWKKPNGV